MNIILVTDANVRARTLTVGWQHAVAGASMVLVALAALALLDGLGQRLARSAGLKPQDLLGLEPGSVPGRGGAVATTLPIRDYSVTEFAGILETLKGQLDRRAEQFGVHTSRGHRLSRRDGHADRRCGRGAGSWPPGCTPNMVGWSRSTMATA